jgi:Ca2+:H+ antiporter
VKDKIDLSISVAVGSSIQIALFVIPVIQLLAWTISKPMTLMFDRMSVSCASHLWDLD